ncbi:MULTISPECIES: VPA1262 family N-terminal domain-containing protein [unclassified Herbaspirillum]|uniref:VPA1262 family N-terminal domain-containing protein n=1 Tax=unclassified Herbaspirillum TaxID=2624150 RepID=UPI000E2FE6C6|nr:MULTISPECIES: VPA1262 family N-terminal domain-containing protein [unclassified Herbaspirillum]RFB67538.1 hypothetical protein DZB54_20475 [Herbaspirillum sp. 3R-3a1]TFI05147.1 hypothetical protein E4P32_23440 [Herbaspirillum sp. 3R11]TFI12523.1 hypothetical protein E4P31_20925 [Herbaspirillum sp. 3R-11]TFI28322.1 hypothetical protein E4P30_08450 [Herbaspirillum sp. 3C11]
MNWSIVQHVVHLQKLLAPDLIGNYSSFEVTEIVGFNSGAPKQAVNFLSLLVAEPGESPDSQATAKPEFLNGRKAIELRGIPWKFGIVRYRLSISQIVNSLQQLDATGEWKLTTSPLKVGNLIAVPPQFVPSDSVHSHPWNGVLKNNFWNGSHVLELYDSAKMDVKFLWEEPKLLKELAARILEHARIGIDGLSDRLGNVVIQLPVTVVTTKVSSSSSGDFSVHPHWQPGSVARKLRVSCEKYEDSTIEGFGSKDTNNTSVTFPISSPGGGARYILWDDPNEVVVGASGETLFITSIALNMHLVGSAAANREFTLPAADGTSKPISIPLLDKVAAPNIIGTPHSKPNEPWRTKRVFRDSLHKLRERKEFVQYGGLSGAGSDEAFEDIHWLLRQHGNVGAWLWDPFLDAKDILYTLFYCPHAGADLRALTAGAEPPVARNNRPPYSNAGILCQKVEHWFRTHRFSRWMGMQPLKATSSAQSWREKQQDTFQRAQGNGLGLNLEFRIREGHAGWQFHDRFLIFPSESGGATAWSLGTSVNSFGQKHHILQKVSDGELIRQAFLDLWNELNSDDYLVWKTP